MNYKRYQAWLAESGMNAMIRRQQEDAFWANKSDAFKLGYSDCVTTPDKATLDPSYNEFDHDFNPFVTRSVEWDDYRSGCEEYYDRHERYDDDD